MPMIRVVVRKSELYTARKSELQPDGTPKSEPNCPKQVSELGLVLRTKIAQSTSLAISALMEPNGQKSRRKRGFGAQKSQLEIADRLRLSIAPLNRNAKSRKSLAISGVRDGHRNRQLRGLDVGGSRGLAVFF